MLSKELREHTLPLKTLLIIINVPIHEACSIAHQHSCIQDMYAYSECMKQINTICEGGVSMDVNVEVQVCSL